MTGTHWPGHRAELLIPLYQHFLWEANGLLSSETATAGPGELGKLTAHSPRQSQCARDGKAGATSSPFSCQCGIDSPGIACPDIFRTSRPSS